MRQSRTGITWAVLLLSSGIVLNGCKKQEEPAQSAAPEQPRVEAPAQPAASAPAGGKSEPAGTAGKKPAEPAHNYIKELVSPARLKEKAPETYKVKFDTTRGE